MKLKVGDKLLCKFDYFYDDWAEGYFNENIFTVGKYYTVMEIVNHSVIDACIILIKDNTGLPHPFKYEENSKDDMGYIWNYFYRDKELRKLKLDELEGRR